MPRHGGGKSVNDGIRVRSAEDGDVEEIVALWGAAGLLRPWNDPRHDIAFARNNAHSTVLVATHDGAVVGTATIGQDGHRGWIYYVASEPDMRRHGIGRRIMEAAERWLAEQGVWKVQLLIRFGNQEAEGFYEKLGYTDTRSRCFQKVLSKSGNLPSGS